MKGILADELYKIMSILYGENVPIVFKGSMVLNNILLQHNSTFIRQTQDIDSSWIGENLSMSKMTEALSAALAKHGYMVNVKREMKGAEQSAGFIIYKNDMEITRIDMDIHQVDDIIQYKYGDCTFFGIGINEIFADKFAVVSSRKIFRRIKDFMDIYTLSEVARFNSLDVRNIIRYKGWKLGNFEQILENEQEVFNSFKKFNTGTVKPNFDEVYERNKIFANAFNYGKDFIWDRKEAILKDRELENDIDMTM